MKQSMGNGCVNITPNVGNGNNVRIVYTDGYVGNCGAYISYGMAPACWLINNPE